jgi:hypothetical protein
MDVCTAKAMGVGRDGATHITARPTPIAQAGEDLVCVGLLFAESDRRRRGDPLARGWLVCRGERQTLEGSLRS